MIEKNYDPPKIKTIMDEVYINGVRYVKENTNKCSMCYSGRTTFRHKLSEYLLCPKCQTERESMGNDAMYFDD